MNLVKKLIVGGSLAALLGLGGMALSNENLISNENASKVRIYLASLIGSTLGVGIAYKSSDRVSNYLKKATYSALSNR